MDTFINTCKGEISGIRCDISNIPSNLTKEEHRALSRLRNRKDVLIKPADKRGAVVVWDKDLYMSEAERQLSDTTTYKKLDHDKTKDNNNIVSK